VKKPNYNHTIYACFLSYVVQAVNINFAPLLFLTFQKDFALSLNNIAMITTVNFVVQLIMDIICMKMIDKIGYRASAILAHVCAVLGLSGLAYFPGLFDQPFIGILLAVVLYAIGGGVMEVLISPIVESCPGDKKEGAMSLSHSFYCWGFVGVVLISSIFFAVFGIENWRILAVLWAILPLIGILMFCKVPIAPLIKAGEEAHGIRKLIGMKEFWVLIVIMVLSGACEQGACQWASVFAESTLQVPKFFGDLAGPLLFAVMMGFTRVYYGKNSEKLRLEKAMLLAGALCLFSYLLIALAPNPALGFVGFALCGVSVAIFWPGTTSLAAKRIRGGGTALFAFLALAGDLGCAGGPALVGFASELFGNNLRIGFLAGAALPILMLVVFMLYRRSFRSRKEHRHA